MLLEIIVGAVVLGICCVLRRRYATVNNPRLKLVGLHDKVTGERLTQNASILDIVFLTFNNWRIQQFLPALKRQGFLAVKAL